MKRYHILPLLLLMFLANSCSENHQAAEQHLTNARSFLTQNEFERAKAQIDSINILYPKSFEQRKAGIPLLDSVRKAENSYMIAQMDVKIAELQPKIEALKANFAYQKDAKYQETGVYVPKSIASSGAFSHTTLYSGVEEDGRIYIESIYVGGQKHNKIKITAGNNSAESLVVEGDGYIHRFNNLGKTYEVIRFIGANENGVAEFISKNMKQALRVHLSGTHNTTYTLPQNIKNAVEASHTLSQGILLMDSLKTEKEKAGFRNFYLDNGKQTSLAISDSVQ